MIAVTVSLELFKTVEVMTVDAELASVVYNDVLVLSFAAKIKEKWSINTVISYNNHCNCC